MIDQYRRAINELRLTIIGAPLAMMATAIACSSGAVSPTPDIDVPEGWKREEARTGLIGRDIEYWDLGFTIDLPSGWIVEEVWPNDDHPTGILIGDQDARRMIIVGPNLLNNPSRWQIDGKPEIPVLDVSSDQAGSGLLPPPAIRHVNVRSRRHGP